MEKGRKRSILIPACIAALLAVVYTAGLLVFSFVMMPHTQLTNYQGRFDVSWQPAERISDILQANDATRFTIRREADKRYSFLLSDIKADHVKPVYASNFILEQPVFSWPKAIFEEHETSLNDGYDFDARKLEQVLSAQKVCEGTPSEDAYITVSDEGVFSIVDEVYGTELAADKVKQAVLNALADGKTEYTVTGDLYIPPQLTKTSDSIQKKFKKIEKRVGRTITIDLYGTTEEISAGYFYNTKKILKKNKFEIQQKKLDAYMAHLTDTYDTYGKKRDFIAHTGKTIQVGAEGDKVPDSYGFTLNAEETRKALEEALNNHETTGVTAVWDRVGNGWSDQNSDIGNTYIEISIDEQHLWYYKEGNLICDADVVTGLPTARKHTPKGIYTMFWKDRNTRLRGSMEGESWDVRVSYWLSVTNTGIGIHTASWQPSFGGDAYTYRGSHGCINVSEETGKQLFDNVDVNTVVVIY